MSWAEIKKSVNSTLGTSGAMPLDKIVKQEASNLKNGLKNGTLIPQKSNLLQDDWIDIELTLVGDSSSPEYYTTTSNISEGIYIASVIPEDHPTYVFLISIKSNNLSNKATISAPADLNEDVLVLKYNTFYTPNRIYPQSVIFGSLKTTRFLFLSHLKLKKLF